MMRNFVFAVGCFVLASSAQASGNVYDSLANLAGEWVSVPADGEEPVEISYEIAANGFSVIEHLWGMVTVYSVDGDRVLATHYCSAGNQPRMDAPLQLDDTGSVTFSFLDVTGDSASGYIDSVSFQFLSPDRFVQSWTWFDGTQSVTGPSGEFVRKDVVVDYEIEQVERENQLTIVKEASCTTDEVGRVLGEILPAAYGQIIGADQTPAGAPFSRYLEFSDDGVRLQAGLPIADILTPTDGFELMTIPGGTYIMTTHYGSYDSIGGAYEALHVHMENLGLTPAGAPFESYVDDPSTVPAPEVRTFVYYPVQPQ